MFDIYELESTIEEQNLVIYNLQTKIDHLVKQNEDLKQQVTLMAMENSNLLEVCSKNHVDETRKKWAFYHAHKDAIKSASPSMNWWFIKKKTDELYAQHSSSERINN